MSDDELDSTEEDWINDEIRAAIIEASLIAAHEQMEYLDDHTMETGNVKKQEK